MTPHAGGFLTIQQERLEIRNQKVVVEAPFIQLSTSQGLRQRDPKYVLVTSPSKRVYIISRKFAVRGRPANSVL